MPINVVTYTNGMIIDSPIYFDSNFPISFSLSMHDKYNTARNLRFDLIIQKTEVFISNFTFDEAWHILRRYFNPDTNRSNYINIVTNLTNNLLGWPNARFLPIDSCMAQSSIQNAFRFLTQQNLRAADSFHLALAIVSNASGFITSDNDFDNINIPGVNLTIYKY